uniref:Uncharacterized protein n=1 Tax=Oryza punctata TaxID=4537 RepID=A0A0E0L960_ORYPU
MVGWGSAGTGEGGGRGVDSRAAEGEFAFVGGSMSAAWGVVCGVCGEGWGSVGVCCTAVWERRWMWRWRGEVRDRSGPESGFYAIFQQHHGVGVEQTVVERDGGGGATTGLQELQFFSHDDHDSVAWLLNDPTLLGGTDHQLHQKTKDMAVDNGVTAMPQR